MNQSWLARLFANLREYRWTYLTIVAAILTIIAVFIPKILHPFRCEVTNAPVFIGTPGLIETSFAIGDKAWDFSSMLLKGNDETELWIFRNDASFPEPTLSFSRVAPGN